MLQATSRGPEYRTKYVYDGMLPIQERNATNGVLVTYTRGLDLSASLQGAGGIGGLLARTDASGSAFYHADGAGNVTSLIDERNNIAARYAYNAFGQQVGQWGPLAGVNRYRFSSKEVQPFSGLYYYGFRFFDPSLQRWLNQDPLGEAGGINLYGFVGNSPLNRVDPFGLEVYRYSDGRGPAGLWLGPAPYVYGETRFERYLEAPLVNTVSALANVPAGLGGFADWLSDKTGLTDKMGLSPTEALSGINPMAAYEFQALRQPRPAPCHRAAANTTANPKNLISRQGPSEMSGNQVRRLTKDMQQNGFDPAHPVEVANVDGQKIIIDGHHRAAAASRAGLPEVPVRITPVTPEQAAQLAREAADAAAEWSFRQR